MAENFVSRIILQDGFSDTARKFKGASKGIVDATGQVKSAVEQASTGVGKLRQAFDRVKGVHKTEFQAVGLGTVNRNVQSIQSQIERLTNKPAVITAKTELTRNDIKQAKSEVKELKRQLKDLTGQKYDIDLNIDGQQIQGLGGKLKGGMGTMMSVAGGSLLAGGVGAVAAGIGGGVSSALGTMWQGGNERQQYLSTMTHFTGSKKDAKEMMKWANQNAAKTQFSSSEILGAASRAVQVADGSVVDAKKLTALAEDMASLTPGKSVMDAMEALADAQMGEFERMKEFGFKGSADALKEADGDFWKMKGANGKTVTEMFEGGTAAGMENTSAKIGTITGNFEDALASAGEKMLNGLNPALDWLIEKSDGAAEALGGALEWAGEALGTTFTNVKNALTPYMPMLMTLGSLVGTTVSTAFSVVGSVINNLVLPAFQWVGENVLPIFQPLFNVVGKTTNFIKKLGDVVKGAVDKIGEAASNAWGQISNLGSSIMNRIRGDKHATGAMAYGGLTQINENMKGELIRLPDGSRIYPYETTRRLLAREYKAANGGSKNQHNVFNINVDARGSNLTNEQIYRLKRSIVQSIIDAFDNTVPA